MNVRSDNLRLVPLLAEETALLTESVLAAAEVQDRLRATEAPELTVIVPSKRLRPYVPPLMMQAFGLRPEEFDAWSEIRAKGYNPREAAEIIVRSRRG